MGLISSEVCMTAEEVTNTGISDATAKEPVVEE
jgi:hypothetical protein